MLDGVKNDVHALKELLAASDDNGKTLINLVHDKNTVYTLLNWMKENVIEFHRISDGSFYIRDKIKFLKDKIYDDIASSLLKFDTNVADFSNEQLRWLHTQRL